MKRKDVPVRNNPGIYKRLEFDPETSQWKDTGKYRAVRSFSENGKYKKEQGVFDYLSEAKSFRLGLHIKVKRGKISQSEKKHVVRFSALAEDWKKLHYLKLERGTKEQYDKLLPHLDSMSELAVESIDSRVVFRLIEYWRSDKYPKTSKRESFEKELALLRTILNFYKRHYNHAYGVPVYTDHFQAGNLTRKQRKKKEALSLEQFSNFLNSLKNGYAPQYYSLALAQFSLGLRIGEVCGLHWDCVDLDRRVAIIRWVVEWENKTMYPHLRPRTKTGREKVVAIPDRLLQELRKMKVVHDATHPDVPLVFHDRGIPFSRKKVRVAFNCTLRGMGITHVSGTHLLRHTAATAALRATGDIHAVKTLLGHQNLRTTEAYIDDLLSGESDKIALAFDKVLRFSDSTSSELARGSFSPKSLNGGKYVAELGENSGELNTK